jgi:hypothetical protein
MGEKEKNQSPFKRRPLSNIGIYQDRGLQKTLLLGLEVWLKQCSTCFVGAKP